MQAFTRNKQLLFPFLTLSLLLVFSACPESTDPGPADSGRDQVADNPPLPTASMRPEPEAAPFITNTRNFPDFSGLGRVTNTSMEPGSAEAIVSPETPEFEAIGAGINISGSLIEEPLAARIEALALETPIPGIKASPYRFSMDAMPDNPGFFELRIPYDPAAFDPARNFLTAAYLNQDSAEWEPVLFDVDTATNSLVVHTNHLSVYTSFIIDNAYRTDARISNIYPLVYSMVDRDRYYEVFTELNENNMQPGESAIGLGKHVVEEWLGFSGALLTLEGHFGGSDLLERLSDIGSNLGTALSLYNILSDLYTGDRQSAVFTTVRDGIGYSVGKWGSASLQLAYVGIFFFDYSLQQLGTRMLDARYDGWNQAYRLYYQREGRRSAEQWYNIIMDIHRQSTSPQQFKSLFEAELKAFSEKFWVDADGDLIADYQQRVGLLGSLGGLTEDVEQRIAEQYRYDLLTTTLVPVFKTFERNIRYQKQDELRAYFRACQELLNTSIALEIREEIAPGAESRFAGYQFRMAPLRSREAREAWQAVLDSNGRFSTNFTILAFLSSGVPDRVEFFPPESRSREFSLSFGLDGTNPVLVRLVPSQVADAIAEESSRVYIDELQRGISAVVDGDKLTIYIVEITNDPVFHPATCLLTTSGNWRLPLEEVTYEDAIFNSMQRVMTAATGNTDRRGRAEYKVINRHDFTLKPGARRGLTLWLNFQTETSGTMYQQGFRLPEP